MPGAQMLGTAVLRLSAVALTMSSVGGCASPADDAAWHAPAAVLATPTAPQLDEPDLVRVLELDGALLVGGRQDNVTVEVGNDGALTGEPGPDDAELVAKFPDPCTGAPTDCPKALVEVEDTPRLSPEHRAVRFGATVRVRSHETTNGSNILQKGFASGGRGQYKLQLDDLAGHPSCVLVGRGSDEVHSVVSSISIADGGWHEVVCHRVGDVLTILVDQRPAGSVAIPLHLSIHNSHPVRIGAKNRKQDNDQFYGALESVYVEVEPRDFSPR